MALSKALEELLALITDENDRKTQRALLEKHDVLRERNEGYLRQSDYDRQMNQLKSERAQEKAEIETARANIKKWQDWYDQNQKTFSDTVARNKNLEQEKTIWQEERQRLQEQIKAAAEAGGEEVNLAAVQQAVEERIKNLPYASQADVQRIVAEEAKKAADAVRAEATDQLVKQTLPAWSGVVMDYTEVLLDHQQEFGEKLDRKQLADFMTEKGINNVRDGHNAFVAERRAKRQEEELKKKIESDIRKELTPVPGSGAGPTVAPSGAIVQRIQADAKAREAAGTGGRIGDGSAARAAAQDLIEKGKY